jgi:hypothetical protein
MHDYLQYLPMGVRKVWPILTITDNRHTIIKKCIIHCNLSENQIEQTQGAFLVNPLNSEIIKSPERFSDFVNTGTDNDDIQGFQLIFNNPEEKGSFETEETTAIPQDDAVLSAITLSGATEDVGVLDMPVELGISAVGPCAGGWEGEFAGAWEGVANVDGTVVGNAGPGLIDLAGTFDATSESTDMTMPNYGIGAVEGEWKRPEVSATIQPPKDFRNRVWHKPYQKEVLKTSYYSNGRTVNVGESCSICRWSIGLAPNFAMVPTGNMAPDPAGGFALAKFPPAWQTIASCSVTSQNQARLENIYPIVMEPSSVMYLTLEVLTLNPSAKNIIVESKADFY